MNTNQKRQEFLLSFFDEGIGYEGETEGYQEVQVNGFWLVKTINGVTGKPLVMIYTEESFKAYKQAGLQWKGRT